MEQFFIPAAIFVISLLVLAITYVPLNDLDTKEYLDSTDYVCMSCATIGVIMFLGSILYLIPAAQYI